MCLLSSHTMSASIHGCVVRQDVPRLRHLLSTADPDARCDGGWTALMYAAHVGNEEILQILLESKASVNAAIKVRCATMSPRSSQGTTFPDLLTASDIARLGAYRSPKHRAARRHCTKLPNAEI